MGMRQSPMSRKYGWLKGLENQTMSRMNSATAKLAAKRKAGAAVAVKTSILDVTSCHWLMGSWELGMGMRTNNSGCVKRNRLRYIMWLK